MELEEAFDMVDWNLLNQYAIGEKGLWPAIFYCLTQNLRVELKLQGGETLSLLKFCPIPYPEEVTQVDNSKRTNKLS